MNFYSQVKESIWIGGGHFAGLTVEKNADQTDTYNLELLPKSEADGEILNQVQHSSTPSIPGNDNLQGKLLTPQSRSDLMNKINRVFWAGLGCWSIYNLIDSGLARFLALETLTHGTGPLGYIGININGADPNYGGGSTGSAVVRGRDEFIEHSRNFFHVFKDSGFPERCEFGNQPFVCTWLANKILPRVHAVFSGMANFGYSAASESTNLAKSFMGGISGFITPTLKFRFTPEEILNCNLTCRFENDPDYGKAAYRTSKAINASHLGISGSLSQGINSGMFNRMSANPEKVLLGIILLGTAALVARTTYRYIKSSSEQQIKINTLEISPNSSNQSMSDFQNCKKKVKVLTVNSCWAALAITTIFLNTV